MARSNPLRTTVITAALLSVFAVAGGMSCNRDTEDRVQGYIEAEYIYIAPVIAGNLTALAVKRGDLVKRGELLYSLDREPEASSRKEAEDRVSQARARHADLQKGQRPVELAAIEAQLAQAQAALGLSRFELERRLKVFPSGVSKESVEQAQSAVSQGEARVREIEAQLETARLGAREDQVAGAAADVSAFESNLSQISWRLEQKTLFAPVGGLVYDTYYNVGEWVQAGSPVLAILPPEKIKVRFYVSTYKRAELVIGQTVKVDVGAGGERRLARVNYISPQAEYTPPVIYSREMRSKLVFMVEAQFEQPGYSVLPGQPVDVELSP
jgi:HlyD family secretion protein